MLVEFRFFQENSFWCQENTNLEGVKMLMLKKHTVATLFKKPFWYILLPSIQPSWIVCVVVGMVWKTVQCMTGERNSEAEQHAE